MPGFVIGPNWLFIQAHHPLGQVPPGFAFKAAGEAVRINGFYLFFLTADLRPDEASCGIASNAEIRAHVRSRLIQLTSRRL